MLHEGAVLAEGAIDAIQADERVIEVYLGSDADAVQALAMRG